ncbi:MAG: tetratricopeptide repeat protein [Calditrichaeota bacterium]|nr:tetratricopeptide repeat protein [Calditrichota bacterium]
MRSTNVVTRWRTFSILILFVGLISCQTGLRKETRPLDDRPAFTFYYQSLEALKAGDLERALSQLDSAILLRPNYSQFYCVRGHILQMLNRPDSAIAAFEQCLIYKSYNPDVWLKLGKLYLQQGHYEKAAYFLKKCVPEFPDSVAILLKLGKAQVLAGHAPLARDALVRYARRVQPPDPEYWKWWGVTHYLLKNDAEAISALRRYTDAHPQDVEALRYLGMAYFRAGKYDQGLSYLNRVLQLQPDDVQVYVYRARYFMHFKKPHAAREQLELALAIDSTSVPVLLEMGRWYIGQEQFQDARKFLEKARERDPENWEVYKYLGMVFEQENDLATALEYFTLYLDHTIQRDPDIEQRVQRLREALKRRD